MIVFQRVPPRRRNGSRQIQRPASKHLRVFYSVRGKSKRHHVAVVVLPTPPALAQEFLDLCAIRLLARGLDATGLGAALEVIRARLVKENAPTPTAKRAPPDPGLREAARVAARRVLGL